MHIFTGVDHMSFLLGLVLIISLIQMWMLRTQWKY